MPQAYLYSDGTPHGTHIIGEDGKPMGLVQRVSITADIKEPFVKVVGERLVRKDVPQDPAIQFETFEFEKDEEGNHKMETFTLERVRLGLPDGYFIPAPGVNPMRAPLCNPDPATTGDRPEPIYPLTFED